MLGRVRCADGTVVAASGERLRGGAVWIYAYGTETGLTAYSTDPSYWAKLRELPINAVRVVCFDAWQRSNNWKFHDLADARGRSQFLALLDRVVDLAEDFGFYALIDYHDEHNWNEERLAEFWRLVAPRYASRTHVLYELVNEPAWLPSDFTPELVGTEESIYRIVRGLAPETHIVLLSFANLQGGDPERDMVAVASLLTCVDWSNASVGAHAYQSGGSSLPLARLKDRFPVLVTEVDLPEAAGGSEYSIPMDGEEWCHQTLERLGISWFTWSIDGFERLEKHFVHGVLADAQRKGYLWTVAHPGQAAPKSQALEPVTDQVIFHFLREHPIRLYLQKAGVKPLHVAILIGMSVAIAFCEGLLLALLIPLARGVGEGNFEFAHGVPFFGPLLAGLGSFPSQFVAVSAAGLVVGIVKNALQHVSHMYTARLNGLYVGNLSNAGFERYLTFGKSYFDGHPASGLAITLNYAYDLVHLGQGLLRILSNLMVVAGYFLVMCLISWRLTLVALAIFLLAHLLHRRIVALASRWSAAARDSSVEVWRGSYEILSSITLFQSYGREKLAQDSFRATGDRMAAINIGTWRIQSLLYRSQELTVLVALMAITATTAFLLTQGRPSELAVFLVFFFVARLALPRLSILHEVGLEFGERIPKVDRFREVIEDTAKHAFASGTRPFDGLRESLEIRNLTFFYPGGRPALRDVNVKFRAGQLTAIVGPSGAGKSTLMQLLTRFYDAPPGTILLDGTDIREFDVQSVRKQMALLSQDAILLNTTLGQNIAFGPDREVSSLEVKQALDRVRLELPPETMVGDRGVRLSGGQRQRVALARALIRNSPILLLDEATSSLDSRTEAEIQAALEEVTGGRTSIVIAHRLSTIRRADWIVVLNHGRVAEQGTLAQLIENRGLFSELWEAQKLE